MAISQYMHILNHYVVHLKLKTLYVKHISISFFLKKEISSTCLFYKKLKNNFFLWCFDIPASNFPANDSCFQLTDMKRSS